MSRKNCIVCHELFNTKDHKPLIIPKCFHNICEVAARMKEFAYCPVCNVTYSELLAADLQVDKNLLEYISVQELHCNSHPQECAVYFCATHNAAQCFNCKHTTPCNSEDLANNDSRTLLKESIERVAEVYNLNKTEVMQRQAMFASAEEKYQLLVDLLRVHRPVNQMCSVHGMIPAQFFNLKELRPVCQRCVEKHPDDCCDLSDRSAKEAVEQAMRQYSESINFYLFPEMILKFLAISPSLDIGIFVQVAHDLDDVRHKKRLKPGDKMYCPLCIRPSSDFHRLPCSSAIHAICASCDFNLRRQEHIYCPLDHNICSRQIRPNRAAQPHATEPEFAQWEPLDMTECEHNPRAASIAELSKDPKLSVSEAQQDQVSAPMELYQSAVDLGIRELARKQPATPQFFEGPMRCNDHTMCKNTDSRPAVKFGVSKEEEFYCDQCADSKPIGEVFPMELYEIATRLGLSEFVRRQRGSSGIRTLIQSLTASEEAAKERTKRSVAALNRTLGDWITARNNTFTEWIRQIEVENEEYSRGQVPSVNFDHILTLSTSIDAYSRVLGLLYDLKPLLNELAPYQDFKESHSSRQFESFVEQISELRPPQPTQSLPVQSQQTPSSPEPPDALPTWYPLLSDTSCKRWNLDEKRQQTIQIQWPNAVYPSSAGVVHVKDSSFFFCGCGTSKRQVALVDLNTGSAEMYPDLSRERESCGLISYQGSIYFFGGPAGNKYGLTRSLALSAPTLSVERLSLSSHQYQERADMINPRFGFNAARWRQKVYLVGGWNSGGTIDVYDLLTNSFTTLPDARAYDRISYACVVGEELVVFSRDTMRKWRINESGLGRMEERKLSTSVDDLWSNLTPINTMQGVICVQFPTGKMYTLDAANGNIREERLR